MTSLPLPLVTTASAVIVLLAAVQADEDDDGCRSDAVASHAACDHRWRAYQNW